MQQKRNKKRTNFRPIAWEDDEEEEEAANHFNETTQNGFFAAAAAATNDDRQYNKNHFESIDNFIIRQIIMETKCFCWHCFDWTAFHNHTRTKIPIQFISIIIEWTKKRNANKSNRRVEHTIPSQYARRLQINSKKVIDFNKWKKEAQKLNESHSHTITFEKFVTQNWDGNSRRCVCRCVYFQEPSTPFSFFWLINPHISINLGEWVCLCARVFVCAWTKKNG